MFRSLVLFTALLAAMLLASDPSRAVTDYATMSRRLVFDCARNPHALHLYTIGRTSLTKRAIWLVRVSAAPDEQALTGGVRILVICRQHGDEPVSTESAIGLLHYFARASPQVLRRELGSTTLFIIPMANPDGADALNRLNGAGADLNRDWGKFTQPETRAIYSAYKAIRPQAVVDMHSWCATDPYQSNSLEVAGTLSVSNQVVMKGLMLQNEIIDAAQRHGQVVSAFTFAPNCDSTLAHRYFSKCGEVSLLVETAAGWSTPQSMATRIELDRTALSSIFADIERDPDGWRRIALLQGTLNAPISAYTASAASLNPKANAAWRLTGGIGRAARHTISRLWIHELSWTFGVYLAACIVLLRMTGRSWRRSLAQLVHRLRDHRPEPTGTPVYISVHRRHFPDSPVDIGFRPQPRSARFQSGMPTRVFDDPAPGSPAGKASSVSRLG